MLTRLRTQIGTAGLVVAIVALIAALGGGAYAATGGSTGSKATVSAKGKPGPRGKTGKTGPTGQAGPTGPVGPAGAKGDTGAPGANGSSGASGVSVTSSPEPAGAHCAKGGSKFVSASAEPTYACNGTQGVPGPQGPAGPSCNADGECLLPPGATETGIWAINGKEQSSLYLSITFSLRLPEGGVVTPHYVTAEEAAQHTAPAECPGSPSEPEAVANPGEEEAVVCLYEKAKNNLGVPAFFSSPDPRSGIFTELSLTNQAAEANARGTWAVTPAVP